MLTQEPGIRLAAGKSDTVDAALLASTDTNCLAVISKADRVGLGVFQSNQRNNQIDFGILRQVLVIGDNILQKMFADLKVVAALLKGNTEDLLMLLRVGTKLGSMATTL